MYNNEIVNYFKKERKKNICFLIEHLYLRIGRRKKLKEIKEWLGRRRKEGRNK